MEKDLVLRAAKKQLLSRKNIRDRLTFGKMYSDWTAEDSGKAVFPDKSAQYTVSTFTFISN